MRKARGFSLVELLVVIAIIGVISGIVLVSINPVRGKARDARRKSDLRTIGQFLSAQSCYTPNAGVGDYDLADLLQELSSKYPQLSSYSSFISKDPKTGTDARFNYRYIVDSNGKCAIYANLENEGEPITLTISTPTPGQTGVWQGSEGPNGSGKYFQIGK